MKKNVIIRTLLLFLAIANQLLTYAGKNPLPIAESDLYEWATISSTLLTTLWAWWKNNSFTKEAIRADDYLKQLKMGNPE